MNSKIESPFLFTVCQAGAEKALKDELARDYPALRFAFSRPGFVTFKSLEKPVSPEFVLKSVFTRAYGVSLSQKIQGHGQGAADKIIETAKGLSTQALKSGQLLRLHVFERDFHAPGEEPQSYVWGLKAGALERAIRERPEAAHLFHPEAEARAGDVVFDVIYVDDGEWWLGVHEHTLWHSPVPGGQFKIILPPEAPSRAYLKLEEALRWSRAPLRAGDTAVEIGSAPGGASYALLQRGVNVYGIDPGAMDPVVTGYEGGAHFEHDARSVNAVMREELPESVQWLLVDMNVGPDTALYPVERLSIRMRDSLQGVILTLKLNEWSFAEHIPNWIERVRAMGMEKVKATQLPHNRREFCVVGLTRLGVKRLKA